MHQHLEQTKRCQTALEMLDSTCHHSQDISSKYWVSRAGTAKASSTCPQGQLHYICKHVVKILTTSQGYSAGEIILALGTWAGNSLDAVSNLHCSTPLHCKSETDALAELDGKIALSCVTSEPCLCTGQAYTCHHACTSPQQHSVLTRGSGSHYQVVGHGCRPA